MLEVKEEIMKMKRGSFHRLSLSITSISLFLLNQLYPNTWSKIKLKIQKKKKKNCALH